MAFCEKEKIQKTVDDTAKSKNIKPDTRKISYDLFREGKTVQQIAEERNFSVSTIEGHLASYIGSGELQVTDFISKERIDFIAPYFDGSDDLRMGPVKEILGDKVSWSELKFVTNHLRFLRSRA